MKYSEKEMAALIREVEDEFSQHLNKAEEDQTIKKSEKTEAKEETVKKSEKNSEDFSYNDEDFAEMDELYGSMSKTEAEAHYKSVKKAVFGSEISEKEVEVKKSEKVSEEKEEVKIEKSEESSDSIAKSEHQAVIKERDELKKSIEKLTSALGTFLKARAPKRKAITNIEYIAKSETEKVTEEKEVKKSAEEMNETEIRNVLKDKIREGNLNKSDKEIINDYYLGDRSIEKIKHLL